MKNRVVITGIGVVAPNGIGVVPFWQALIKGTNCVDTITFFDPAQHPAQVAAEIKNFDYKNYLSHEVARKMDRSSHFAIAAALEAVDDGAFKIKNENRDKIGVVLGSAAGGLGFYEKQMQVFWQGKGQGIDEQTLLATSSGTVSEEVSNLFGFSGPSIIISNGCTSANDAIGMSANFIRSGELDVVFTGGSDACITPGIVGAFCRLGALSTKRNHEPKKASRPFNIDRDGFVISEGSWVLILEKMEHALERGASIYAEVAGYGATCDAYHITKPLPSGEETARAIKMALKEGNVEPEKLSYINAHGTSTELNDKTETLAIKKALGKHAYSVSVSSMKSMIGHAIGAAGAGGVAVCALAIKNDFIPPTINYESPDPECDLDYVWNTGRKKIVEAALGNSIGFGSKNAAVVLTKYKG
ncbi:MAG: beta-ketoacyl-ACP synthase II [Candidatus Margulisiibacteriota bacterium]